MFDVTADDIACLNDEQLRALIGRLCEAELRVRCYSSASVTWGGNQTAADGGIDVRVQLPSGSPIDGFVPRAVTGFQVKAQDMPRATILEEMWPGGKLRLAIGDLAAHGGAYILVSSQGSISDSVLQNRREAMKEAITGIEHAEDLVLEFFDRTRVATWVRSHESVTLWVRRLIGRAIPGWQAYGSWAHSSSSTTEEYLLDGHVRIHAASRNKGDGLPALQGIADLRNALRRPQQVVRLVGLSGVGKTRLVQALFDERVGEGSLNPDLAIYTNIADGPEPQPIGAASNLIATGTRAVLIVDNCPPDVHQRLSELCRQPQSKLSVLTVEYDVRDDTPEGTDVYTLEPASLELIEKLLRTRFSHLSEIDAHRIAEFSGGNARIAIALAAGVGQNDSVAGLTDEELFRRLFQQRHTFDSMLYRVAQVCALLYSFDGDDVTTAPDAELWRIAALMGNSSEEAYAVVAELQRRDLVQQRGRWRAVLPHAIANRLAKVALQSIPYSSLEKHLLPSNRLLRSLSRRLGFLHESPAARAIAERWLAPAGIVAQVRQLNDTGQAVFANIASVCPASTLNAMERELIAAERVLSKNDLKFLDILRSLAYEPSLFERSANLMARIIAAEQADDRSHSKDLFVSLFHLHLSGTHASIEQRVGVIASLLASSDNNLQALGEKALNGALEAWHFSSSHGFEFGARSRDYGYWPQTRKELQHWFRTVLSLLEALIATNGPSAQVARDALATKLRGLWMNANIPDDLDRICRRIRGERFWSEGWVAIRQSLDYDGPTLDSKDLAQLRTLERALRPESLVQKVRSIILSTRLLDLEDFEDDSSEDGGTRWERTEKLARELGSAAATDEACLTEILPEIVTGRGRLWPFGAGLAQGAGNALELWERLVGAFSNFTFERQADLVLRGYLHALSQRDAALVNALLDEAVEHPTLGSWYPALQVGVGMDTEGVARIRRAIAIGRAAVPMYRLLGAAMKETPAVDVRDIVLGIASLPSGFSVAVDVLYMRLHVNRGVLLEPELGDVGRSLLRQISFAKNDLEDHQLADICKECLPGEEGVPVIQDVCRRLKEAVSKRETYLLHHDDLIASFLKAHPLITLDALCAGDEDDLAEGVQFFHALTNRKDVFRAVPDEGLLQWCAMEPASRYSALADIISPSESKDKKEPRRWTPLALRILEHAPDREAIFRQYVAGFVPRGGWSGSLAEIIAAQAPLLDQLQTFPDLQAVISEERQNLQGMIERQRASEIRREKERTERFE